MTENSSLNIEVTGHKFVSLSYDKDGNVSLAIRFTNGGHNICGDCTIDKSRLQLISDFFNQQNTNS